jgi:hypothetical protein
VAVLVCASLVAVLGFVSVMRAVTWIRRLRRYLKVFVCSSDNASILRVVHVLAIVAVAVFVAIY